MQPRMEEPSEHVHGAGCEGGHGHQGHGMDDLGVSIWGGTLEGCNSWQERALAIEAAPTPTVEDLVGKTRELWRLGKILLGEGNEPRALNLFALAIQIGVRWINGSEGAKFWGDTIYNRFYNLPSVDKVELAVYASWSHFWIIRQCLTVLRQQKEANIPREMLQQRIQDLKKLQNNYVALLKGVVNNEAYASKPTRQPHLAVIWLSLSVYFANISDDKEDQRCAHRAVECDPRNPEAQLRVAVSLLEKKFFDQAITHFDAAIPLLPKDSPELMSAHVGAGYCLLKKRGDADSIMAHVREMRRLDLRFEKTEQLRFKNCSRELVPFWGELLGSIRNKIGLNGICGWCLKEGADKKCSACNIKEFCSVDCFKSAWKGDDLFPGHKTSCAKKK